MQFIGTKKEQNLIDEILLKNQITSTEDIKKLYDCMQKQPSYIKQKILQKKENFYFTEGFIFLFLTSLSVFIPISKIGKLLCLFVGIPVVTKTIENILINRDFNKLKKVLEIKMSTNFKEALILDEKTKKKEEVQEQKSIQEIDPFIQNIIEDIQNILDIRYPNYLEDIKDLRTLVRDYRKELTNDDKNFYGRLNEIELRSIKKIKAFKKYSALRKYRDLSLTYDKDTEKDFSRSRKLH